MVIDTTAPHLQSIAASPASGNVTDGSTVMLMLAFTEAVRVTGGTPTLTLNDGASARYDAVATTALHDATKLAFDYLVSSGDTATPSLAVTGLVAHGATVSDLAGNPINATVAAAFSALSVNESIAPAYAIGELTRPELHFDSSGHIILDAPAAAFAATYGLEYLYAGLAPSTPFPPVPDTHHDFYIV